jgi:hypothetical protein
MPVNGHTPSSHTLFAPRQNGHLTLHRTPVTASPEPSAVRPDGLPVAPALLQNGSSLSGVSSVDGERPRGGGWQDKGARRLAPQASPQPAPDTNGARSAVANTSGVRSENLPDASERKEHSSIWLQPRVKFALQQLARETGVSFSSACDTGLEVYARAQIREQEETLFEPRMRSMLRREIRSSDNRHVPFEIENAIASEQTRILTADLYKRQLQKEGVPLKEINQKLDQAYHMARTNVLATRTTRAKNLVAEYWRATDGQAENREAGTTDEREAGNGKPHA